MGYLQRRPRTAQLHRLLNTVVMLVILVLVPCLGEEPPSPDPDDLDYTELDIAELMQVEVTSVAGTAQPWFTTPAATYVVTGEDVRRTGHRSVPEALRLVPGLNVARLDSRQWAIGARGFMRQYANHLLVLQDGRIVYNSLFSGVFWDEVDLVLEDLDRIEVVRGPGATLWGANAVNGVININSKHSKDTQGLYVTGGGGTEELGFGSLRYGGLLGNELYYRLWGKYAAHDSFEDPDNAGQRPDDWNMLRGGFRIDAGCLADTQIRLQGEAFHSDRLREGIRVADPNAHLTKMNTVQSGRMEGAHIILHATRETEDTGTWEFKTYYDRVERRNLAGFEMERQVAEVDFRHHFTPCTHNEFIWGLNYRFSRNAVRSTTTVIFDPETRELDTFSGFIQDTLTLIPECLFLMAGSKFEHNPHTHFEIQPSTRLWWTPTADHTLWAAVSRPVRTPAVGDEDMTFVEYFGDVGILAGGGPVGLYTPLSVSGSRSLRSEQLVAYEVGYRQRLAASLHVDIAGFYHDYRRLILPLTAGLGDFDNRGGGESYGVETSCSWDVTDSWRLDAGHSFVAIHIDGRGGAARYDEGGTPRNYFHLRSALDITKELEFNAVTYVVDRRPGIAGASDTGSDAYVRCDLGLTWRPHERVELTLWGQNLFTQDHLEFMRNFVQSGKSRVERGVYAQISLRF